MEEFSAAMVVFRSVNLVIFVSECSVWKDFRERFWIRAGVRTCRSFSGSSQGNLIFSKSEGAGA